MENNPFGYLLITKESMKDLEIIALDYKNSTEKFKEINNLYKTRYSCCVVSLKLSWWQRIRLSRQTGIPLLKINNIHKICKFGIMISAASMVDKAFFGRTKVYDSQKNILRTQLNRQIEVIYAH